MIPEKRKVHLDKLLRTIGINQVDYERLSMALTHPSFIVENNGIDFINNQRLEFLGDAVVDLVVGEYLYKEFPHKPEGELTKMRAALVCEGSLANAARRIRLGEYLLIGKGERGCGGANRSSNLADAWESLVGAIYLDKGIDAVRELMISHIQPELDMVCRGHYGDYKTQLQELVQRCPEDTVRYEIIGEKGPDHAKEFTACVLINDEAKAYGAGRTKKEAEQNAACQVLIALGEIEQ